MQIRTYAYVCTYNILFFFSYIRLPYLSFLCFWWKGKVLFYIHICFSFFRAYAFCTYLAFFCEKDGFYHICINTKIEILTYAYVCTYKYLQISKRNLFCASVCAYVCVCDVHTNIYRYLKETCFDGVRGGWKMKGHADPDTNAHVSAVFKQWKNKAPLQKYIYLYWKSRKSRALVNFSNVSSVQKIK